jgi:predicted RNA binding protein YcfA (HicA-like mRNA interferase family)
MIGYSPKNFTRLLLSSGWEKVRQSGDHVTFKKLGNPNLITFSNSPQELNRQTTAKLLKIL